MTKIKSLKALVKIIANLKKQGKKIVFTNGCFDLLHPGHIKVLRQAKAKGDILIVGLNSDSSIKRLKGEFRPILNQTIRGQMLSAMEMVDFITVFNQDTPYETVKAIKPDVLVKGGDWSADKIIGSDIAKKIVRVKLVPGFSTTALIAKIKSHG